ncbi:GntR family transcriptional regulator [Thalassobacillus pellis]|uniref:GntR family transcriptional regulator n=1 Tax=Thalassobacillus pellis TaxID=748008 RepID=UPI001961192E|nr:GntR family transcriptional regulator [Thalassobacillus pellis]MBM7553028.1 GntR family transcriptional regulator [Thalassobacillus pellis]
MLNKNSPLPMYYQIEEDIKRRINTGEFKAGEVIPSERALTDMYDVSRMTVRQAVNNLVQEGILYREKGKGTYVTEEKIEQQLAGLTSFSEEMRKRGLTPATKVVRFEQTNAGTQAAKKLQVNPDTAVFKVSRIRLADELPMAFEQGYFPCELTPGLTESIVQKSLYQYVEKELGNKIVRAEQEIEAVTAEEQTASWLEVEPGSALLRFERVAYLADGRPLEYVHTSYRGDRYRFKTEVFRGN